MGDVFISYQREEREAVRIIAELLDATRHFLRMGAG